MDILRRVKSGQVGIRRVKAGDIFFGSIFVVTLLHQFYRIWSLFPVLASSLRLTQTPDSRRSPGGWGAECRVWTVNVGSEQAVFLLLDLCAWLRARFPAIFVGLWAVCSLAAALLRLQIPCQRETWLHDDDTLSIMPIRISAQGYYITVFDAFALDLGMDRKVKCQRS